MGKLRKITSKFKFILHLIKVKNRAKIISNKEYSELPLSECSSRNNSFVSILITPLI
jgi:hypothetical protein